VLILIFMSMLHRRRVAERDTSPLPTVDFDRPVAIDYIRRLEHRLSVQVLAAPEKADDHFLNPLLNGVRTPELQRVTDLALDVLALV
jgi:hypothetical protein